MTVQKKYPKTHGIHIPSKPWMYTCRDLIKYLQVSIDNGLQNMEVKKRHKRFGPNRLKQIKKRRIGPSLLTNLKSLIMILLAAVYVPTFAMVLDIVCSSLKDWAVIICMSLILWVVGQILKSATADLIPGNHARWLFMGGYSKKLIGGQ